MTGPLAPLFAQVREAIEFGYGGDPNYRPYYEQGIAALSSIERHVQDTETLVKAALRVQETRGFLRDHVEAKKTLVAAALSVPADQEGEGT